MRVVETSSMYEITRTDHGRPGDNPEILARRLLREKFGKHHAFNQPIHYPPRSYH
jgi:hypothetical protein